MLIRLLIKAKKEPYLSKKQQFYSIALKSLEKHKNDSIKHQQARYVFNLAKLYFLTENIRAAREVH